MNQTQTQDTYEQTEATTDVTVEEVEDGRWVVKPGARKVAPGETVKFRPAAQDTLYFIMDDRLFGGVQRFKVTAETGPINHQVATREKGLFPYVVLVDTGEKMILAEGSALPVFVVDY